MKTRGFTIVEILISIAIIGILASIIIVSYNSAQDNASSAAVEADMSHVLQQAAKFRHDNGRYPTSDSDIRQLNLAPSKDAYYGEGFNYGICISDDNLHAVSRARNGDWYEVYVSGEPSQWTPESDYEPIPQVCTEVTGQTVIYSAWIHTESGWTDLVK